MTALKVRISATIANEYADRCPEDIPERVMSEGVHKVSREELQTIHDDAAFNSDLTAQDVGPYGVPMPVFNAYRALAKQCRKQLAQSVSSNTDATNAKRYSPVIETHDGHDTMPTATNRTRNSHFVKGQGVYECRCCLRRTRATGNGDNDGVRLCVECYDLAGEENSLSDTGDFYDSPANVLALIEAVTTRGGNASCWDTLKAEALKRSAPAPAGCFDGVTAEGNNVRDTTAAYARAHVERLGAGRVVEFHGNTACLIWAYQAGEWWLLSHDGQKLHQQAPSDREEVATD